jgi:hypothetical protein
MIAEIVSLVGHDANVVFVSFKTPFSSFPRIPTPIIPWESYPGTVSEPGDQAARRDFGKASMTLWGAIVGTILVSL